MSNAKQRVQLDLPEKSLARLTGLKEKTEATSYTEVVKNALRLYEAVVDEASAGNTFFVRNADGGIREYIVF